MEPAEYWQLSMVKLIRRFLEDDSPGNLTRISTRDVSRHGSLIIKYSMEVEALPRIPKQDGNLEGLMSTMYVVVVGC